MSFPLIMLSVPYIHHRLKHELHETPINVTMCRPRLRHCARAYVSKFPAERSPVVGHEPGLASLSIHSTVSPHTGRSRGPQSRFEDARDHGLLLTFFQNHTNTRRIPCIQADFIPDILCYANSFRKHGLFLLCNVLDGIVLQRQI